MSFYSDPAFFILVAVVAIPAVLLGFQGKSLKHYGFGASLLFLLLLFSRDIAGLCSFVFFLVVVSVATIFVQHCFTHEIKHAIAYYRVALACTIMPLVVVKIGEVFDENILAFIGISYLTFKAVQVLIEIRDGLIPEMSLTDYWYFLVFFPPFTSGPIQRSRDFISQINQPLGRDGYKELLAQGALWLLLGVMYYFVLSMVFQWLMWFVPSALGNKTLVAAAGSEVLYTLFYGLNMFFNFAGYSFMAMGVASVFGIKVPTNFRAPFCSVDIKDFWNRWHITLSHWLRDYVFMRVSRSLLKHKVFDSRLTAACCGLMTNMVLMGVWHGLTIDCIMYGCYHGILLSICEVYQKKSQFYKVHKKDTWYRAVSWAVTMIAVFFGFALFNGQVSSGVLGVLNG